MNPEEKNEFRGMQNDVRDILRTLKGDPLTKEPGFVDRLIHIEERLEDMDMKVKKLINLAIGIAIGILIGGIIFGVVSWKSLVVFIKEVL